MGSNLSVPVASAGQPRRVSPKRIALLVVAGYTIPCAYLFGGILTRLNKVIAGPFPDGDAFFNVWHIWLAKQAIAAGQDPAYTNRIFALRPGRVQIFVEFLYSDWIGSALQLLMQPLAAYNLLIVSSFVLSGCTTYLLTRQFVDNRLACFAAGWFYTFSTYHFARAGGHLGLATVQWLPFCAWTLIRLVRQPSLSNAVLAGVGVALVPLSDIYYVACFLVPFGLVFLVRMVIVQPRWLVVPSHIGMVALAGIVALTIAAPPLRSYLFMRPEMAAANQALVDKTRSQLGADLARYVVPHPLSVFAWPGSAGTYERITRMEKDNYLGLIPIVLAVVGLSSVVGRATGALFWLAVSAAGVFFSLGPVIAVAGRNLWASPLYEMVFGLPLLSSFRAPNRTSVLALLGVSVLAAYGVQAIIKKARRQQTLAGLGLLVVLVVAILDTSLWGTPYPSKPVDVPALYHQIASDPDNVILLNLPLSPQESHQFLQTVHGKRLPFAFVSRITPSMQRSLNAVPELRSFWVTNGSSEHLVGFRKDWQVRGATLRDPPSPHFKTNLQSKKIRYVVMHHTDNEDSQTWMKAYLLESLGDPFYDNTAERVTAWCVDASCPP